VKCETDLETGENSWVSDRVPIEEVHCSYNRRYLPACKLEDQPIVDDGLWKCDKKFRKCKLECFNGWNAKASIVCEDDVWKSKSAEEGGDLKSALARKGAYSCKTHNLRVCNAEYLSDKPINTMAGSWNCVKGPKACSLTCNGRKYRDGAVCKNGEWRYRDIECCDELELPMIVGNTWKCNSNAYWRSLRA